MNKQKFLCKHCYKILSYYNSPCGRCTVYVLKCIYCNDEIQETKNYIDIDAVRGYKCR